MAAKSGKSARPAKGILFVIVVLILICAIAVSWTVAWFSYTGINRDNTAHAANLSNGVLQLWAYESQNMLGPDGSPILDSNGKPIQEINWDSGRLLDGGENAPTSGEFTSSVPQNERNKLFTLDGWQPNDTQTMYLVVRNYDPSVHGFLIHFVNQRDLIYTDDERNYLAEAICTNIYNWTTNDYQDDTTKLTESDYDYYEVGTNEMIGRPIEGDVPGNMMLNDDIVPGLAIYRLDLTFSGTASQIYANQGFGLDAYVAVGQYAGNEYDKRLPIRTMDDLAAAFSLVRQPDGTLQYDPTFDPDSASYVGAENDPDADRRARIGDTVYILDSFKVVGDVVIQKQVNLYFYSDLEFGYGDDGTTVQGTLSIDIAADYAHVGPMDIGDAKGTGRLIVYDSVNRDKFLPKISAPEGVWINWYEKVCPDPQSFSTPVITAGTNFNLIPVTP